MRGKKIFKINLLSTTQRDIRDKTLIKRAMRISFSIPKRAKIKLTKKKDPMARKRDRTHFQVLASILGYVLL